jgi:hypothetical protein
MDLNKVHNVKVMLNSITQDYIRELIVTVISCRNMAYKPSCYMGVQRTAILQQGLLKSTTIINYKLYIQTYSFCW